MTSTVQYLAQQIKPLIGATFLGLREGPPPTDVMRAVGIEDPELVLVFWAGEGVVGGKDGVEVEVGVWRDEEGNGNGWLSVPDFGPNMPTTPAPRTIDDERAEMSTRERRQEELRTKPAIVLYYDDEKTAEQAAVAFGCMMINDPEPPPIAAPTAISYGLPEEVGVPPNQTTKAAVETGGGE